MEELIDGCRLPAGGSAPSGQGLLEGVCSNGAQSHTRRAEKCRHGAHPPPMIIDAAAVFVVGRHGGKQCIVVGVGGV